MMLKPTVPEFSKVTVCAGLVVSTDTFPKETLAGEIVADNWLLTAEKAGVLEPPRMASRVRAASRIAALARAGCGPAPGTQHASGLRALPVWRKASA
jgi:hypothetical protein